MRMLPKIAVVIVTYNSAAVLPDCLRSLPEAGDGVHLTEVVVADNASTDESQRIAEAAAADVPVPTVQLGSQLRVRRRDQCRDRDAGHAAVRRCPGAEPGLQAAAGYSKTVRS